MTFAEVKPATRPMRWMWMPMSFMFLLLGVALGIQTSALFLGSKGKTATAADDFSLSLSIAKSGDNLTVRWNRNAPAVRLAQRGVLEIDDGDSSPAPVSLDQAHLENGTMIYRNSSKTVRFKLTVYENSQVTVTEKAEWP
jgi:hypothetical protein